jgi:NhaP-type Na+/H+ and K+/H+ antiporter
MPETVRIAAVLRGPVLLSSADTAPLLRNDTLVLVGPATDVQQAADALLERPRAAV